MNFIQGQTNFQGQGKNQLLFLCLILSDLFYHFITYETFIVDLLTIRIQRTENGIFTFSVKYGCRDDPDLERMLKERVRWGDPMTHFVKVTALTKDFGYFLYSYI